ncbi:MAG: ankyrin repeat domain-containing protein [Pedosphaera sp.]|nr:ankyrin repeat domain-containing protein [Pedosphaera sp.]
MKQLITATIAAVLLVGCGESQESSAPEAQPAEPVAEVSAQQSTQPEAQPAEPVAEVAKPEPPTAKAPEPPSAKAPDISITQAAETGNIEAIKQHLAAGADVNTMTASLHRAAYNKHKEIIELLITNGVDVNAKNDAAETPLHLATTKEIAELLIANGADVNATTNRGTTPLDWAANDEIASLIRKHGGKSGKK